MNSLCLQDLEVIFHNLEYSLTYRFFLSMEHKDQYVIWLGFDMTDKNYDVAYERNAKLAENKLFGCADEWWYKAVN